MIIRFRDQNEGARGELSADFGNSESTYRFAFSPQSTAALCVVH